MDQLHNYADDRLLNGCIYCGGIADTRDHVPSRCLLEPPYPENLPVVDACTPCNRGFSQDEEYLACLIESVLSGSTDPSQIKRPSIARTFRRSIALRARIENARSEKDGQIQFAAETDRVSRVMLKLARGHAAFELSQPCRDAPEHFWCGPLATLTSEQREAFDAAHIQELFGEAGSRGLQRMLITQLTLQSESGELSHLNLVVNDWVDVQPDLYRYIAIDDGDGLIIRIVLSEYLGCEAAWRLCLA